MQPIRNLFTLLPFALSLLGCLVDDETPMPGGRDDGDLLETWDDQEHPPAAEVQSPSSEPLSLKDAVRQMKASNSDPSVTAIECEGPVGLYTLGNSRYVTAELSYGGGDYAMLRARATAIGSWERYDLCYDNVRGTFSLKALGNNRYVSAELGYGGGDYAMLRARATAIGPWERFYIYDYGAYIAIQSAANGKFVSAELGYSGGDYAMLRARAAAVGPWERFQ